jgi:hypothetical protein
MWVTQYDLGHLWVIKSNFDHPQVTKFDLRWPQSIMVAHEWLSQIWSPADS